MKRYIALLLCLALALGLTACVDPGPTTRQRTTAFLATILQITDDRIRVVPEDNADAQLDVRTGRGTIYLDRTGREIDRAQLQVGSRVCVSCNAGAELADGAYIDGREFVLQSAITAQPGAAIGSLDDCTEPPTLYLQTTGQEKVQQRSGCYDWTFPAGGGEMTTVCACGNHPLDEAANQQALTSGGVLYIRFDYPPDSIRVRCWPQDCFGKAIESEQQSIPVDCSAGSVQLQPGLYCYELTATWRTPAGVGGTAYYAFTAESSAI